MNIVTLTHKEPAKIEAVIEAFNNDKLFDHFMPLPNGEWDYMFCVENWGTKWDAGSSSGEATKLDNNTVDLNFDSAWSPPLKIYEAMHQQGFQVTAYFYEPGLAYVGKIEASAETGYNDEYYEYGDETSDTVRDYIGEELDDYFGISESMKENEEEN